MQFVLLYYKNIGTLIHPKYDLQNDDYRRIENSNIIKFSEIYIHDAYKI